MLILEGRTRIHHVNKSGPAFQDEHRVNRGRGMGGSKSDQKEEGVRGSDEASLGRVTGANESCKERPPPGTHLPPISTEASSQLVLREQCHSR